jgi:hypothetical protein
MISIILATPCGGKREFKFTDKQKITAGGQLAQFCWDNRVKFFTDIPKPEQVD